MAIKTFLDLLREGLKPETYSAVVAEMGEDFEWAVVPYSRFSKVIGERNALRDKLNALESGDGDGDGDGNTASATKKTKADPNSAKTPEEIQKMIDDATAKVKKEYEDKEAANKLREAGLAKLREAGALDAELIYDAAKFDKSKFAFGDDGKLKKDADETVAAFKKANPALFGEGRVKPGTGKDGGSAASGAGNVTDAALDTLFGIGVSPVTVAK